LVERFLSDFAAKEGEEPKTITEEALALLMDHDWPGNVRELKNIVERLVIMTPSRVITAADIPLFAKESGHELESKPSLGERTPSLDSESLRAARQDFEKQYILRKLRENDGNISRTAEAIGLERSNLHKKIKSYGLDVERQEGTGNRQ